MQNNKKLTIHLFKEISNTNIKPGDLSDLIRPEVCEMLNFMDSHKIDFQVVIFLIKQFHYKYSGVAYNSYYEFIQDLLKEYIEKIRNDEN